jgi:hypothetical protein
MVCWFFHKIIKCKVEGVTYFLCWNCGMIYFLNKDGSKNHLGSLSPEPFFYEDLCMLQRAINHLHYSIHGRNWFH